MSKKLIIAAALLGSLAVLAFAGGQGEKSGASTGKKWAGKTITAIFFSSTYADMAKQYTKQFEQQTGGKVQFVTSPYATLHQKEGLALKSGSSEFDIMQVASQWDGEFAPYVTNLAPYIKKSSFDSADIMKKAWDQSGIWNGKIMGIPESYTAYLMSYRTDLLPNGVPNTWAALFNEVKKYENPAKSFYPFATPCIKSQCNFLFLIPLWSLGGRWATKNWNVTIDSPQALQALRIAKQIIAYSNPAALSWGLPEADAEFLSGHAAIDLAWPTLGVTVNGNNPQKSKVVGKWALADFPHEKTGITELSAWDVTIPKNAQNKQMAWDWMQGFLSKKEMTKAFQEYSILAPRKSFWASAALQNSPLALQGKANAIFWWRIPAGTQALGYIADAFSSYLTGQWSAQRALQSMKNGLMKALTDNPPAPGILNLGR